MFKKDLTIYFFVRLAREAISTSNVAFDVTGDSVVLVSYALGIIFLDTSSGFQPLNCFPL